jgi:L-threonate 2-dehydrogenase
VRAVAHVVDATGTPFVDAGIIGGPPKAGGRGPTFYASGASARNFAALSDFGLTIKVLDGPVGEASALKMSYAGVTKGLTALAATMALASTRAESAPLLAAELAESQPELSRWIASSLPGMYSKAYRWVAEMREIASFIGPDQPEARILEGAAELYERLAVDFDANQSETGALSAFVELLKQR